MTAILGVTCKLYINVSALATPALRYATPTWSEWQCLRDITVDLQFDSVDSTCRGSAGFKTNTPTLADLSVNGNAVREKADASYIAAEAAAFAKTILDVLVLDGDRTLAAPNQADGWRLDCQFQSWSEAQPYADILTNDWVLKPARSSNVPHRVTGPL
jgi:hypothetical protein